VNESTLYDIGTPCIVTGTQIRIQHLFGSVLQFDSEGIRYKNNVLEDVCDALFAVSHELMKHVNDGNIRVK
jgi:hypothetical protein